MTEHKNKTVNPAGPTATPASDDKSKGVSQDDKDAHPARRGILPPWGDDAYLERNIQRVALALGWMLVGAGCLGVLWLMCPVAGWIFNALSPFLVALVVAYLFNPIVNVVQRRFKLGRLGGILAVAGFLVLLTLVFFGLLLPILYVQSGNLIDAISSAGPDLIDRMVFSAQNLLERLGFDGAQTYRDRALAFLKQMDMESVGQIAPRLTEGGVRALGGAADMVGMFFTGTVAFLASAILVFVIAFYCLLEFDAIPNLLGVLLPHRLEHRALDLLGKMDVAVGGFLRGQLIVCCLVGLLATVGLSMIGMHRYALIVGVLAGAANFIPYLGPAMGTAPALLWALCSPAHDTWPERFLYAGLVIALFVSIQTLDGFVFQPRIVGRSSHLHPLAVIAALVIGGQFGLGGMILAVPLACIARVLIKELWWDAHVKERKACAVSARKR